MSGNVPITNWLCDLEEGRQGGHSRKRGRDPVLLSEEDVSDSGSESSMDRDDPTVHDSHDILSAILDVGADIAGIRDLVEKLRAQVDALQETLLPAAQASSPVPQETIRSSQSSRSS